MQPLSLGYLGPPGSFSQQAALNWMANASAHILEAVPCDDLEEVAAGVNSGRFFQGIIPLENSLEGSVTLSLDLLAAGGQEVQIQGEVVIPVHHNLVSLASELSEIETLYSMSHVFPQCRRFLRESWRGGRIEAVNSTALAARRAAEEGAKSGAIASALAARLYGLRILRAQIEDYPGNETRFVVLGHGCPRPTGCDKTSLLVAVDRDRPGALYSLLAPFAETGINLTRIESRPGKRKLGEYIFFIDCQAHVEIAPLPEVLQALKERSEYLRVLGSYPAFQAGRTEDEAIG